MCRIAGIISPNFSQPELFQQVKAMCDSMAHGGPDDEGLSDASFDHFVFGHRRLSLIDLSSAGHQPMVYHHLLISFNGEIYNYEEIRNELLSLSHSFKSHSDTEVILAGFAEWGTAVFERLEGMFAFALYDRKKNATYLVRDQSGIKPLYYSTEHKQLVFASEVKAFGKTKIHFEEDPDWPVYFLSFGHLPDPYTTLKGVYALEAGTYLKWMHDSHTYEQHRFGQIIQKPSISDPHEAEQLIRTSIQRAVEKHLIADVPVGVFLSGGIDSSLLTLIANQLIGERLKTLSINFAEQEFSEGKYQQLIAGQISGAHHSYTITAKDLEAHFDEILSALDQPSNDAINSWFVNKCAKENGLKAVLSGVGADELFGGYPSFSRMGLIRKLKKLPSFLLKTAEWLPSEKLKRISFLAYRNPVGEYLFLRGFFSPKAVSKILNMPLAEIHKKLENFPIRPADIPHNSGDRASWMETRFFMKNQLLKDTDFMSMTHAVEVRVPFLDQELIRNLAHINPAVKYNNEKPKALLVNSFIKLLPEAIWNRPKKGFTFPLQQWLRHSDKLNDANLYRQHPYVMSLMSKFKAGKLHWSKAYALFQLFKTRST